MENKAEYLFERLGYKKKLQTQTIKGEKSTIGIIYKSSEYRILFLFGTETYVKCSINPNNLDEDISMDEHIAISQQIKELGWLNKYLN